LNPVTAAIALSVSMAQAPPRPFAPYNCQADLGRIDGASIGWVNMSLNGARQPVGRELFIRTGAFDASWQLDAGPPSRSGAMDPLSYTLELPADTSFPVTVAVAGDGRPLWRGSFERPAGTVVHGPPTETFSSIVLVWGRGHPIRNIYGIRRLEISVRPARGGTIHIRAPLPDWTRVARRTRSALLEVERQRRAGRCGLAATP
jgi:hypothetical protein